MKLSLRTLRQSVLTGSIYNFVSETGAVVNNVSVLDVTPNLSTVGIERDLVNVTCVMAREDMPGTVCGVCGTVIWQPAQDGKMLTVTCSVCECAAA